MKSPKKLTALPMLAKLLSVDSENHEDEVKLKKFNKVKLSLKKHFETKIQTLSKSNNSSMFETSADNLSLLISNTISSLEVASRFSTNPNNNPYTDYLSEIPEITYTFLRMLILYCLDKDWFKNGKSLLLKNIGQMSSFT